MLAPSLRKCVDSIQQEVREYLKDLSLLYIFTPAVPYPSEKST